MSVGESPLRKTDSGREFVGRDSTDRHGVTSVAVGHEYRALPLLLGFVEVVLGRHGVVLAENHR